MGIKDGISWGMARETRFREQQVGHRQHLLFLSPLVASAHAKEY